MFGFRLVHQSELEMKDLQISTLQQQLKTAQFLAEHWEKRFEESLERADRQLDGFLQQNGLPQVTTTSRKESLEDRKKSQDDFERQMREMGEIFSDQMNTLHDAEGLELPPELAEDAKKMMGTNG